MIETIAVVSRDTTAPVLALEAAKAHLDVTFDDDNALIQSEIDNAVQWVENYTSRFLQPVVINYLLSGPLPPIIRLPYGPIVGVTAITVDGVAVTGFRTIAGSPFAVLAPAGASWPYTATDYGVSLEFNAGYGAGEVPSGIIGAIKQIVSIFYDKPVGTDLTSQWNAVERMLSTYRIRNI